MNSGCCCYMQLVDEAPEDEDLSGLEVTSAFTANVWEVCPCCTLYSLAASCSLHLKGRLKA